MPPRDQARDEYLAHFREKLWELVPGHHRHEDGLASPPGVLRAFIELIAEQAANQRRRDDRLWDDAFIELCDDWAVPYLGDLVATRLVSALDRRGRRVDVAKTIYYRRRKGTPRVLEELIGDITGWEGKVVEAFRGLARCRHGLDPAPAARGRFTGTPAGGTADLRRSRVAVASDGPFGEYAHTADMRRPRGQDGRWAIPRVHFHLHRLQAFEILAATPFRRADGATFTFDPSGRDVPLFARRRRLPDWDAWSSAAPWELPAPIPCRLLGHAEYELEEPMLVELADLGLGSAEIGELRGLVGRRFADERTLHDTLARLPGGATLTGAFYRPILARALVAECGKRALLAGSLAVTAAPVQPETETTAAGQLADFALAPPGQQLVVDPERGRGKLLTGPPTSLQVRYHVGLAGELGASTYDRDDLPAPTRVVPGGGGAITGLPARGVVQLDDDATYTGVESAGGLIALRVQARERRRPYLRLTEPWVLTSAAGVEADLVLDGLWLGATGPHPIVLRGAFRRVEIRCSTLDPGGVDCDGQPIHAVPLAIEAQIDELIVDRSIVASVAVAQGSVVDHLRVVDSVVDGGTIALVAATGETHVERSTVFGCVQVDLLWASDSLFTDLVAVTDTQHGCFRFSAAATGSRLPHPFESVELADARPIFTSRRLGDPGYAQLSAAAPEAIAQGGENGNEMGVWNALHNRSKLDGLASKVREYLPFGLSPTFLFAT